MNRIRKRAPRVRYTAHRWKHRRLAGALVVAAGVAVLAQPSVAIAQQADAREAALCYERYVIARVAGQEEPCFHDVLPIVAVILHSDEYPDAVVEAVLDAWGWLAVTSDNKVARTEAIGFLSLAGQKDRPDRARIRPGIVRRLETVYQESARLSKDAERLNRFSVLRLMERQTEVSEAVRFLEQVVRDESGRTRHSTLARDAIKALSRMGPEGEQALERLERSGIARQISQTPEPSRS